MQIKVPSLGESITEATVAAWLKKEGDYLEADTVVVELETDKITVEVHAPIQGMLSKIVVQEGETVTIDAVLGEMTEGKKEVSSSKQSASNVEQEIQDQKIMEEGAQPSKNIEKIASPAAQKISREHGIDANRIKGTGKEGRITKEDVHKYIVEQKPPKDSLSSDYQTKRVKMSRLRQKIAERLKASQNTAAMLTTFNEIDMTAVMDLREKNKVLFEKRHGVKLGFMSFFTKACIQALFDIPTINAEINDTDIIYKNYYNIGIAVGTENGLVVPVLKRAETMSFAEIEKGIMHLADKARSGSLTISDLSEGTFTITNGGVYGSLLSTPILNPPQSGILGLHKIQKRPIVVEDEIVIRPMMYVALTYDHRLIDGKEAVHFLVKIKQYIEDPATLLIGM